MTDSSVVELLATIPVVSAVGAAALVVLLAGLLRHEGRARVEAATTHGRQTRRRPPVRTVLTSPSFYGLVLTVVFLCLVTLRFATKSG